MSGCGSRDVIRNMATVRWSEEQFAAWLKTQGLEPAKRPQKGPEKPAKYHNTKVVVDGETFDSKGEYARYIELRIMAQAGLISMLRHHVRIPIVINDITVCAYIADFVYWEKGEEVVEDYKGVMTEIFALKRKLLRAVQGKEIRITKAK